MISCRFLKPKPPDAVRLHRAAFRGAWGRLPRWLAWGIHAYSWGLWAGVYSWRQMMAALDRHARQTKRRFGPTRGRQFRDLIALSLFHGVPPVFYYLFGLFRQRRTRWFHYVFEHELPHWHHVVCGKRDATAAARLLSDKRVFAETLKAAGLPAVDMVAALSKGGRVDPERLFIGQSLFLKPVVGSRSEGCCELHFDPESGRYRLEGERAVEGKSAILGRVSEKVKERDYLLQPLLVNHPAVEAMCGLSRLATIRLMTGHDGRKAVCVGAVLEMPVPDDPNQWRLMAIDPETGELLKPCETWTEPWAPQDAAGLTALVGRRVPFWKETVQICALAHNQVSDLPAVGWDAAIAPSGPVLIEGNVNWRTGPVQALTGVPLLETGLLDIYASRMYKASKKMGG
jgi:hypothetical protein